MVQRYPIRQKWLVLTLLTWLSNEQELYLLPKFSHFFQDVILLDGEGHKCRPFSTLLEDNGMAFPENVDIDPKKTILLLPYSSGTTGLPKGVMLSHFNVINSLRQAIKWVCFLNTFRRFITVLSAIIYLYEMLKDSTWLAFLIPYWFYNEWMNPLLNHFAKFAKWCFFREALLKLSK